MTSETVAIDYPPLLLERFLTGYRSPRKRVNNAFIIGGWFTWWRQTRAGSDARRLWKISRYRNRALASSTRVVRRCRSSS